MTIARTLVRFAAGAGLSLCAAATALAAEPWAVDPAASSVSFTASQQGAKFDGHFGSFTATIALEPADPAGASIEAVIDIASVTTGQKERDDTIRSPSFFNASTWANATFRSEEVVKTGDNAYEARGTLTMRDVSQPVVLPFTLDVAADGGVETAKATGSLTIDRRNWGVGQGDFASEAAVGASVTITVDITATRPAG